MEREFLFCTFCKEMYRDPTCRWQRLTPTALFRLAAQGMVVSCCPDCLKRESVEFEMTEEERTRREIQNLAELPEKEGDNGYITRSNPTEDGGNGKQKLKDSRNGGVWKQPEFPATSLERSE